MADIRIQFVEKTGNGHEHITRVCDATRSWPVARVIYWIEAGTTTFHTLEGGRRAEVAVRSNGLRKYLQTHADGVWQNNLLSLPPPPPTIIAA